MVVAHRSHHRFDLRTEFLGIRATGTETTSARGRYWRWDLAGKAREVSLGRVGIGRWNRIEQRFCIGMCRVGVEKIGISNLTQLAEVHDRNPVAHILHNCKVVSDEEHREPVALFHVLQQIQNLSLHRNVECRHGLVANKQFGLEHK